MFDFDFYGEVTAKLIISFSIVLIFFQFSSAKKQFTQMTTIDLISNFILGGIMGGFLYNRDISYLGFIIVVSCYFIIIYFIDLIRNKTSWGRKLIVGAPTVIIKNGKLDTEKLKKIKLSMTDFMSLLRSKDIHSLTEVKLAQIEISGNLTVVKKGEEYFSILLIDNGIINDDGLEQINKDQKWLKRELKKKGIKDINDVFCAQWLDNKFYIIKVN